MGKNIVIIGANEFQLPLVLKAGELGYGTHVFAWREGAVAAPFADRFYPISILEREAILEECLRIRPCAVVTCGSDLGGVTATWLSQRLGLPCNPWAATLAASNKYLMRKAFSRHGVPTPKFALISPNDDAASAVSGFRLPLIVKPTDRSGSRAVTRLDSLSGLESAVLEACRSSFEGRAIAEEFLAGPEYSCECISQYGVHHMLAVTEKFTTGAPHYIETGHVQPSGLGPVALARVQRSVFAALDALGITTGASHTEFRISPETGEINVIETGARMGGDSIGSDLVRLTSGFDYLRLVIEAAEGRPLTLRREEGACPAAAVRFIMNKVDLERLKRLEADPILSKKLVRKSGIALGDEKQIADSSSRFGFYVLSCDSREEAKSLSGLIKTGEREASSPRMLLLGGTNSAEEIRRYADSRGVTLTATGIYPDTLLKRISSERYDVDAVDVDGLVSLIRDKHITAVFPGSNEAVVPAALAAAERCGLPHYCDNSAWAVCMNKLSFKELCCSNGVPTAKRFDSVDDIPAWPVAVKPADSCGSRGFAVCSGPQEVAAALERARGFSPTNTAFIEEYVPYDSVIIHYTLINGTVHFTGMSDKRSGFLGREGSSVMALQLFPSRHTRAYLETLNDRVAAMFKSIGMHDGPVWIEAFVHEGRFWFNEMGYRFGGSMTYYPVRYFYGVDQLELMLDYCLYGAAEHGAEPALLPGRRRYCIIPLHVEACTIARVTGEGEVCAMPDVYAYVPIHGVGDTVAASGTVSQVFCYLHLLYDDLSGLRSLIERIIKTLKVYDENGRNRLFCLADKDSLGGVGE